ncbi:MAG: nucleotidyltransferase domain-containing protein [Terriglobia bacterium]
MNRAVAREFVQFLRASSPPSKFPRVLADVGRRGWEDILSWLDQCGIALLFWERLKGLGEENRIPLNIGVRLERSLVDHRARVRAMADEFDSINRCLEEADVGYAVLKGFALIPEYCSDVFLRPSYDYDYLIAAESVGRAERTLRAAGFIRKPREDDHPMVYFHEKRHPYSPRSRDDLYSAAFPRTIELHYRFWDADILKLPLPVPADMLAHRQARELGGQACSRPPFRYFALSGEDELIFQGLHVFRHILRNWCRLCSLCDIAYFLEHRTHDFAFWSRLIARLDHNQRVAEILGVVFLLASKLFGGTLPARVSAEIVGNLPRPLTLWVERYGEESALSNFSNNKFSLFLHREFIEDIAAWRQIRHKILFPLHRPNRAVRSGSLNLRARIVTEWKQAWYVSRRVRHHVWATMRYGLESGRWYRTRCTISDPGNTAAEGLRSPRRRRICRWD